MVDNMELKEAKEILANYYEDGTLPIDIVKVAKNMGISLGSLDFTELEKKPSFREITKDSNHILGAVFTDDDDLQMFIIMLCMKVRQQKICLKSIKKKNCFVGRGLPLLTRLRIAVWICNPVFLI